MKAHFHPKSKHGSMIEKKVGGILLFSLFDLIFLRELIDSFQINRDFLSLL